MQDIWLQTNITVKLYCSLQFPRRRRCTEDNSANSGGCLYLRGDSLLYKPPKFADAQVRNT
jgi:hypothetical protein